MTANNRDPRPGQVWERANGTRFQIESLRRGYAYYWLSTGSRPQFRSIALANLLRRYHLVKESR